MAATKRKKKNIDTNSILMAIVMIALGVLFMILKGGVLSIAMTMLGVALIIVAVIDLVQKQWLSCVIMAILGIAVIVFGWKLVGIARFVLAAVLLVYGVLQTIESFKGFKKKTSFLTKLCALLQAIVIIAIAVLLLFDKPLLWIVGGIFFVVEGVLSLIKALS